MSAGSVRLPAVAGSFYPAERTQLLESIRSCFLSPIGPGKVPESFDGQGKRSSGTVECFVVPHAGYVYSGPVAAHSYDLAQRSLESIPGKLVAIILGPNHYGIGSGVAISPSRAWQTPLGQVPVNRVYSEKIAKNCDIVDFDPMAHSREHSIEVQIPFIQFILGRATELSIVPISLMLQDFETMTQLADAIHSVISTKENSSDSFLILGSSDLTHYEPDAAAKKKDQKLLASASSLNVREYYTTLERLNVSACGYGAIAALLLLAKKLGKKEARVLKYATSGDVTGERDSVVGYSALGFD